MSGNKTDFSVEEILAQAQANKKTRERMNNITAPLPDPDAEEVRIYVPSSSKKSAFADGDTRVLPLEPKKSPSQETVQIVLSNGESEKVRAKSSKSKSAAAANAEEELMRDQITWDELVAEMEPEPQEEPEDQQTLEERLRAVRREQIRDFSFQREKEYNGFKFSGEEEENEPEEEPEVYEDEVLEDYCDPEDAPTVLHELQYRRRTGWFSLTVSLVFEMILFGLLVSSCLSDKFPVDPIVFVTLNALFLTAMMALGHRTVSKGLSSLFGGRGGTESAVSLVATVALLHTLLQYFRLSQLSVATPALAAVGGLSLLIGAAGRQLRLGRMCAGFRFLINGDLYSANTVENDQTAAEVGRTAVAVGIPRVTYFKKTGFLTKFLENSYAEDPLDRLMGLFLPASSAIILLLAIVYGILYKDFFAATTVFAYALCFTVPSAVALALILPFAKASARLFRHGGLITGWPAVERFGRTQALAVNAEQIFPGECVLLHGIKTFSGSVIDEVILDAAAVSIRAGGPLSHVFRRVIEDKVDILREVDTLVYEQEMGLSGWVAGRRVLVGNRRLMINHGVDVPSKDYEDRYCHSGRKLVYLSVGGSLSGMFIVSYAADPTIASALKDLQRRKVVLLLQSTDPNITEDLMCELFDLHPGSIGILNASAGRTYDQLVVTPDDQQPATLACNGQIDGAITGVSVCRRLSGAGRMMLILQAALGVIGFVLAAVTAFFVPIEQWGLIPLCILLHILVSTAVTCILPLLTRKS